MTFLLDISILVALLWDNHEFHERTTKWVEEVKSGARMATCPITELGFLRVSVYAHGAELGKAREMLRSFRNTYNPLFTPCDIPALEGNQAPTVAKTTDFYLANLAKKNGMQFATLDERVQHPVAFVIPR